MTHGRVSEVGKSQTHLVASTLHTTSEHAVCSITTTDAHTSAASSRLNLRPLANLNKLLRCTESQDLVHRVCHHILNAVYFSTANGRSL